MHAIILLNKFDLELQAVATQSNFDLIVTSEYFMKQAVTIIQGIQRPFKPLLLFV